MSRLPYSVLAETAAGVGLDVFGVISSANLERELERHFNHLQKWQGDGHAGEMHYMRRSWEIFAELDRFLPNVRSVVAFSVSYYSPHEISLPGRKVPPAPPGFGRVARYAWGRDYHKVLRHRFSLLCAELKKFGFASVAHREFSDAVPLLERAIASAVSLGFVGKNCMLIRPGAGSFSFLGEILLDIEVELPPLTPPIKSRCGNCQRCLDMCPTQAFVQPMILDARKCISYLTIEKRGAFSSWEQRAIGSWLFGCDVCQEVCPHNHSGISISKCPEFQPDQGVGPYLSLSEILRIRTDEEFYRKFSGTPLTRAKREGLLRNACAVAANTDCQELVPELEEVAKLNSSNMLGEQAIQAISRLSGSD